MEASLAIPIINEFTLRIHRKPVSASGNSRRRSAWKAEAQCKSLIVRWLISSAVMRERRLRGDSCSLLGGNSCMVFVCIALTSRPSLVNTTLAKRVSSRLPP